MYYSRTTAMFAAKRARYSLFASMLAFSLFLSGCGGAGGLAESVSLNEPDAPKMTGDTATDAFLWINFRRKEAGLPALTRNGNLDKGAKAHSEYQKTNDVVSHDEDPNLPGFTGSSDIERMKAAGYGFKEDNYAAGEVISFTNNEFGENAAEDLFGAIYHRFVMLEPKFKDIGVGAASTKIEDTYVTADMGTTDLASGGLGEGNVIVYPFDGQTRVPVSVSSDQEEPDPAPGIDKIGYPISVHTDLSQTLTVEDFSVNPHGSATPIKVRLLTAETDFPNTNDFVAAILPLSPLANGTVYDVHFLGKAGSISVERSWSFTTAN